METGDNTDDAYRVTTRAEASATSRKLISGARRTIDLMVYDYDEILLPPADLAGLLSGFFLLHKKNRFRYLCSESDLLRERGRALIELARKFSTFIKLRQLPDDMNPGKLQFLVADSTASMVTRDHGTYDYFVRTNDRARARQLDNQFEELWQRSEKVPGIQVTGLSS